MTEHKQSKIPSFKSMLKARKKPPIEKPPSLSGGCSSGGAGGAGVGQAEGKPVNPATASRRPTQGVQTVAASKPASSTEKKVTDYVLGPLQMHCLREFAAGRCDRLEITPAWKVPFIEGVSIGRSRENRDRPAVMRCERRIYSRETGAFAYVSLSIIGSELRASRCSASVERESGLRYEDEDFGEF